MTTVTEIAPDVFSICTYVEQIDLQFRQFLIRDEQPLLYHTGTRRMFERVRDAVGQVMDPSTLRWIAFSHFEADECGALNYWLQEARDAQAACSANGALRGHEAGPPLAMSSTMSSTPTPELSISAIL